MALAQFISALFEHGRVRVSRSMDAISAEEAAEGDEVLAAVERHGRLEFPGESPDFALPAARWAAEKLYRACQLAVHRELTIEVLRAAGPSAPELGQIKVCPAAVHYSVDLVFRFLPDLERLTRGVAAGDPLLGEIATWARAWPLSSIGMKNISPEHLEAIVEHPGLLRYYADRVIAKRDASRMENPRVRAAVRQALGLYNELAPELAALCQEQGKDA